MSLSRLWQQQGKRAETYELLASIYGWCTEGFDTADLQEAKALLEELQGETWRAQHVAETQPPTASHWIAPVIVQGLACDGARRSPAMDAGWALFAISSSLLLLYSWCACSGMSPL